MQNSPISPLDLARSLLGEIEAHTRSEQMPTVRGEFTLWTYAVKHWLDQKGRQFNLRSIYTGEGGSEFMLDFVWWKQGAGDGAVLACEIEWGNTRDPRRNPGRVAADFDKLLSFKAPLKLMIFSSDGDDSVQDETIRELDRYLSEYGDHRAGEQYVVLDVTKKQAAWLCNISQDGFASNLRFKPLAFESDQA